jgi:hypothetical protein
MGECFKGWRRKIGLVTLSLSFVLIGGMIRTAYIDDRLAIEIGDSRYVVTSTNSCFRWSRHAKIRARWGLISWDSNSVEVPNGEIGVAESNDGSYVKWMWHWASSGFEFGHGYEYGSAPTTIFAIPDWLGIPIMFLSAYLLLSKPHKSTSKKTVGAIPEKMS